MKIFLLLLFAALLPMLVMAQVTDQKYLITNEGVSVFKAKEIIPTKIDGYTITKTMQTYREEGEEYEYNLYTIWKNGEEMLSIRSGFFVDSKPMVADDINILSSQFKTAKTIGVGSTIEEFVAAYPDYQIWSWYQAREGDPYILATEQLPQIQFQLDANDFLSESNVNILKGSDRVMLNISNFKNGTRIKLIRIY